MKTLIYLSGITLVALGIMMLLLVPIAIGVMVEQGFALEYLIATIVIIVICSVLITVGVKFVRFAEKGQKNASQQNHRNNHSQENVKEFINRKRQDFANFDLSRLNLWGWLLFISTIGFILLEIWFLVGVLNLTGNSTEMRFFAAIATLLGVAYFLGMKEGLRKLGVRIFHR